MQHLVVGRVTKVDVIHDQVAAQRHVLDLAGRAVRMLPRPHAGVMVGLLELPGIGVHLRVDERHVAFVGLGLLVDELKDAVGAGEAHDHGVDLLRDLTDLSAELLGHVEERHHDGDRQRHARDAQVGHAQCQENAAGKGHQHVEQVAQVHKDGHEDVGVHVGLLRDLEELFVALVKIGLGGRLVAECLDDLLTVHDFLDMALDHAELSLLCNKETRGVGAEQLGHKGHKDDAGHNDQAHPHAVVQHDKEHRDDDDGRHEQVGQRLADHLAQRVDVVGVVAHDVAALVRVEVANRQVLHAVEHLLAQLLERALRDDGHGAVPEERRQDADAVDAGEGGHELCDLGLCGFPIARLPRFANNLQGALKEGRADGVDDGAEHHAGDDEGQKHGVEAKERLDEARHGAALAVERALGGRCLTHVPRLLPGSGLALWMPRCRPRRSLRPRQTSCFAR